MKTQDFLHAHAVALITERREGLQLSYKELARRLKEIGLSPVTDRQLAKRINRGNFSFAFAMALLLVLEKPNLKVPRPPAMQDEKMTWEK